MLFRRSGRITWWHCDGPKEHKFTSQLNLLKAVTEHEKLYY